MRHRHSDHEPRGGGFLRRGPFADGDFRRGHRDGHREHGEYEHGEHEHHGRGRHRHGRRSGRLFDHGELRLVVLALISERPRHGYEIIKEIEDRVAGTYTPSPGVIYPTLTMLEELGHATVTESEGKKLYAVTADGTAYLAANKTAVDNALQRMQSVNTAHSGGPAPEIMRARENLKLALRLREARGPLSEQQIRDIAAALDAAAVAIERS
ncbi:transcriptional regulator, PadR family [Bradyrhizobium canariense]|uniref:Transcriptional regulator, PadR family n=1 Tax=Bradyrhizobium canariense TaxID=255045 RepID=A0A1H2BQ91_9BRAD|nr:transcriptional regulator, PadR family [Bradyrhizobium canariense]